MCYGPYLLGKRFARDSKRLDSHDCDMPTGDRTLFELSVNLQGCSRRMISMILEMMARQMRNHNPVITLDL